MSIDLFAGFSLIDGSGNPIMYNNQHIRDFVTKFEYEYKEAKEGDECTIDLSFNMDNMGIFDIPELQKKQPLQVQWGYKDRLSPWRTIVIMDREKDYSKSGNSLTLICTSWTFFLANVKSDGDTGEDLFAKVMNTVRKGFDVQFTFPPEWAAGETEGKKLLFTTDETGLPVSWDLSKEEKSKQASVKRVEGQIQSFGYSMGYSFVNSKAISTPDVIFNNLGINKLEEINDILKQKSDSLILDSRDKVLEIRNRQLNAPAIDSFTYYRDDRIVSFSTETNDKMAESNVSVVLVDDNGEEPVVRVVQGTTVQGDLPEDIDFYFSQTAAPYQDDDEIYYTIKNGKFFMAKAGEGVDSEVTDPQRIETLKQVFYLNYTNTGEINLKKKESIKPKVVPSNFYNPKTVYPPTLDRQMAVREITVLKDFNLFNDLVARAMPNYDVDDITAQLTRQTTESELQKIEGTLVILGDPQWTIDTSVMVDGVSLDDTGKYYVHGSTHRFDKSGYLVTLKLWKAPRLMATVQAAYEKKIHAEWEKLEKEMRMKLNEFYDKNKVIPEGDKREFFIQVIKAESDSIPEVNPEVEAEYELQEEK